VIRLEEVEEFGIEGVCFDGLRRSDNGGQRMVCWTILVLGCCLSVAFRWDATSSLAGTVTSARRRLNRL
jgi:hypothetical protein